MSTPTKEQTDAYQGAFDFFNKTLFDGQLNPVILNFSRSGARTIAFFASNRWKGEGQGAALHEVSLSPLWLHLPTNEIMAALVHEMGHLWQEDHGNKGRGTYHNKEFATKMRGLGLPCDNGRGGEVGQSVSQSIEPGGAFDKAFENMPDKFTLPFRVFVENPRAAPGAGSEGGGGDGEAEPKPKSGNRAKYTCPGCKTNTWGKHGLNLICGDCQVSFIPVS